MNIFHLDNDPIKAAQMMLDKHVVKMIVEYAQLMSTAHRVLDGEHYYGKTVNGRKIARWKHPTLDNQLYKASHVNHPSNIWLRESDDNYFWLYRHFRSACKEYTHRYGKYHLTDTRLSDILLNIPKNIPKVGLTKFAQAMPDYCKREDPVDAYRFYYLNEKRSFAKWTNRDEPDWWKECA
jgi:hypothetical protein